MSDLVIAFAGAIGSGKTTLSNAVCEALDCPRVGFGDYVRQVARSRGLDDSRQVLQNVGASLVDGGVDRLCRAVLSQADWRPGTSLVIDGVRHVEVMESLRRLVAPSELRLVFVAVDDPTRLSRLVTEDIADKHDLDRVDDHSTEAQVRSALPTIADLVVTGGGSPDELAALILLRVQEWQAAINTSQEPPVGNMPDSPSPRKPNTTIA
ncbi:MAG: AAA family ATPase [Chloroflexota bacterium]|nr:AAA family ATPase [Chloroflexota bacterium]